MKQTTKLALEALLRNMSQEDWFNSPLTRTMEKTMSWMNRELTQLNGSHRLRDLKEVMSYVTEMNTESRFDILGEASVSDAASYILECVSFGSISPVSDLATLVSHLYSVTTKMEQPTLLSNEQLSAMADLAPGGLFVLSRVSPRAVRSALKDDYGLSISWTGHSALIRFIEEPNINSNILKAANRILTAPKTGTDEVRGSFVSLISGTLSSDEKEKRDLLLNSILPTTRPEALFAPKAEVLAGRLKSFVNASEMSAVERDIALVFNGPSGRGAADKEVLADLRDVVYDLLSEGASLPTTRQTPEENLNRVRVLLADGDITPGDISKYRALYLLVRPPGYVLPKKTVISSVGDVLSVADGLNLLSSISSNGILPARGSVDKTTLRKLERVFGATYNAEFIDKASRFGYVRSSMSLNEQYLRDVLSEVTPQYVSSVEIQYRHQVVPKQPFDFLVKVDDYEVLLEAQGQQHFLSDSKLYDPVNCRRRDRKKAMGVRDSHDEKLTMLCVHHRLTSTGPKDKRIRSNQITELIDLAYGIGAWWTYVRPVGCKDLGATPKGMVPVLLDGTVVPEILSDLEVFVLTKRK